LDVSQSGNIVTATDDQDEEYEGIVTGGTYYLTRTEPPIGQGGTERTSYTYEVLLSDNDHGQGEGAFVWDDDCDDCYGEWNITLDRRYQNINAASSTGGTISSPGDTPVVWGGNVTYSMTPQNGYEIRDILVDGASVGAVESYTFSNVTSDHTISALFRSRGLAFLPLLLD